jgi:hypothetical protein
LAIDGTPIAIRACPAIGARTLKSAIINPLIDDRQSSMRRSTIAVPQSVDRRSTIDDRQSI